MPDIRRRRRQGQQLAVDRSRYRFIPDLYQQVCGALGDVQHVALRCDLNIKLDISFFVRLVGAQVQVHLERTADLVLDGPADRAQNATPRVHRQDSVVELVGDHQRAAPAAWIARLVTLNGQMPAEYLSQLVTEDGQTGRPAQQDDRSQFQESLAPATERIYQLRGRRPRQSAGLGHSK